MLGKQPSRKTKQGFTLLECLVALSIVAIGLLVSMQAGQRMLQQQNALHKRQLADLSANNLAYWVQQQESFSTALPNPQTLEMPCPQDGLALVCVVEISNTANRNIRKVGVRVFDATQNDAPFQKQTQALATVLVYVGGH